MSQHQHFGVTFIYESLSDWDPYPEIKALSPASFRQFKKKIERRYADATKFDSFQYGGVGSGGSRNWTVVDSILWKAFTRVNDEHDDPDYNQKFEKRMEEIKQKAPKEKKSRVVTDKQAEGMKKGQYVLKLFSKNLDQLYEYKMRIDERADYDRQSYPDDGYRAQAVINAIDSYEDRQQRKQENRQKKHEESVQKRQRKRDEKRQSREELKQLNRQMKENEKQAKKQERLDQLELRQEAKKQKERDKEDRKYSRLMDRDERDIKRMRGAVESEFKSADMQLKRNEEIAKKRLAELEKKYGVTAEIKPKEQPKATAVDLPETDFDMDEFDRGQTYSMGLMTRYSLLLNQSQIRTGEHVIKFLSPLVYWMANHNKLTPAFIKTQIRANRELNGVEKIGLICAYRDNHWRLMVADRSIKTVFVIDTMKYPPRDLIADADLAMKPVIKYSWPELDYEDFAINTDQPEQSQKDSVNCGPLVLRNAELISLGLDPLAIVSADNSTAASDGLRYAQRANVEAKQIQDTKLADPWHADYRFDPQQHAALMQQDTQGGDEAVDQENERTLSMIDEQEKIDILMEDLARIDAQVDHPPMPTVDDPPPVTQMIFDRILEIAEYNAEYDDPATYENPNFQDDIVQVAQSVQKELPGEFRQTIQDDFAQLQMGNQLLELAEQISVQATRLLQMIPNNALMQQVSATVSQAVNQVANDYKTGKLSVQDGMQQLGERGILIQQLFAEFEKEVKAQVDQIEANNAREVVNVEPKKSRKRRNRTEMAEHYKQQAQEDFEDKLDRTEDNPEWARVKNMPEEEFKKKHASKEAIPTDKLEYLVNQRRMRKERTEQTAAFTRVLKSRQSKPKEIEKKPDKAPDPPKEVQSQKSEKQMQDDAQSVAFSLDSTKSRMSQFGGATKWRNRYGHPHGINSVQAMNPAFKNVFSASDRAMMIRHGIDSLHPNPPRSIFKKPQVKQAIRNSIKIAQGATDKINHPHSIPKPQIKETAKSALVQYNEAQALEQQALLTLAATGTNSKKLTQTAMKRMGKVTSSTSGYSKWASANPKPKKSFIATARGR